MGSSNSGVAGSMHASFLHPSIANLAALPGPLFKLSQVLRGCPPLPAISTALAAAHLSRNNTGSNYITLSGKGAVALPASNLFSLSLPLHLLSTRLFQTFGLKVRNRIRVRKHGGKKKRGRRQSAKVASFHFNTFFPFPFDV